VTIGLVGLMRQRIARLQRDGRLWRLVGALAGAAVLLGVGRVTYGAPESGRGGSSDHGLSQASPTAYLALVVRGPSCAGMMPPDETYGALQVAGSPSDPPAANHPDVNLKVRGYVPTDAFLGLVDYGGGSDPRAPQLATLFSNPRVPQFTSVYQVYMWDWDCNCPGSPITEPAVTLLGMATVPSEPIEVPASGYRIGDGYEVLVLFAEPLSITLKYTREDNVVNGYTLHLEGACIAPDLLALYEQLNAAGRQRLPALRPGQTFGRAPGTEIRVAVRDAGSFLDPRSRKDWWQGE
jgi:hypothetical protein